jgi:hypothetical protein
MNATKSTIYNVAQFSAENGYLVATGIEFKDGSSMSSAPPGYKLADFTYGPQNVTGQADMIGGIANTVSVTQSAPLGGTFLPGKAYKLVLSYNFSTTNTGTSNFAQDDAFLVVTVVTPKSSATGAPVNVLNLPTSVYYGKQINPGTQVGTTTTQLFEYTITIPANSTQVYDTLEWTVNFYGNSSNPSPEISWEIAATEVYVLNN